MDDRFKDTEVGTIPRDWEVCSIEEVATVIRGASPRPKGDSRYYGGEIPRLMVEDVTRDGKYVTPSVDYLTEEGAKRSRPCEKGTLTLVCSGDVGMPSFLAVDACIHDGFLALTQLRSEVEKEFLYYLFEQQDSRFEESATHGGVFTNLTTSILRDHKIPLPPTEEQRAIAGVLAEVDELIMSLDTLIEKKRAAKRASLRELLLGEKRLSGFSESWEEKNFGDVVTLVREQAAPRAKDTHNFCVELEHIGQGTGRLNGSAQTSKKSSLKTKFAEEDVLFSKLRPYLRKYWMADRKGVCSTEIWVFRADQSVILSEYLYQVVRTREFIKRANESHGTHMPRADWEVVKNYRFDLPPLGEQRAIAEVLSDMDAEIGALEKRRNKMEDVKKGMMQELLTGKTRLLEETASAPLPS